MGPADCLEALGKKCLALPGTELEFLGSPSCSLGAIWTAPSWLTCRLQLALYNTGGTLLSHQSFLW